jgi:hypothetical protein
MSKRKCPPVIEAMGKVRNSYIDRMTDADLQNLHDLALIILACSRHTMQQRGMESSVAILLSTQK